MSAALSDDIQVFSGYKNFLSKLQREGEDRAGEERGAKREREMSKKKFRNKTKGENRTALLTLERKSGKRSCFSVYRCSQYLDKGGRRRGRGKRR